MKQSKQIILQLLLLTIVMFLFYGGLKFLNIAPEIILFILIPTLIAGFTVIILLNRIHNQQHIIRIGIDIHGMIDYDPKFFFSFSSTMVEAGHEIHIMTGSEIQPAIVAELRGYGIMWTHLFSISDYYKNKPNVKLWRDERGRPWVDPDLWNQAKGLYAKEQNLDLVLDDTQEYGQYFSTSFAFCKIINKSGKSRGPKAVMPDPPQEEKTSQQIVNSTIK